MARVDYYALEQAIADHLRKESELEGVRVEIEKQIDFGVDSDAVFIYLDRRDAPAEEQRLSAGTRTDFLLTFSLWCLAFHLDSVAAASELRDDLLGRVEVALMRDRTFGGLAGTAWLEGGEFDTLEDNGFLSAAEVRLVVRAHATT